jgi:hypothetical protein
MDSPKMPNVFVNLANATAVTRPEDRPGVGQFRQSTHCVTLSRVRHPSLESRNRICSDIEAS